ncbi:hypothetical protein EQV77_13525 [Halobacillus fulvus]|nr:hypothetical protein EQV77_13525 [Halobacillus fulvus]
MIHKSQLPLVLVEDFDFFLHYLQNESVKTTKKKGYIQRKHCFRMNEQLNVKQEEVTEKSDQFYYPRLHLFYHIVLASGLVERKGNSLKVQSRVDEYEALTDVEKFFFLLETFWVNVDWTVFQVAPSDRVCDYFVEFAMWVVAHPPEKTLYSSESINGTRLEKLMDVFQYFGVWTYELDPDKRRLGSYVMVKSVRTTAVGWELLRTLCLERRVSQWNVLQRHQFGERADPGDDPVDLIFVYTEESEAEKHGLTLTTSTAGEQFIDAFREKVTGGRLEKSLAKKVKEPASGTYTFEVTFQDERRVVQCPADTTFEELHEAIVDWFGFEEDHLYSFFLDGKPYSSKEVSEYGPIMPDWTVGDQEFAEGDSFLYVYDFGNEQRVWIKVVDNVGE